MHLALESVAVLAVLALPLSAHADDERVAPFGARGQFVLGSAARAGISHRAYENSNDLHFSFGASPWLEWFFVKDLSVGVSGGFNWSHDRDYSVGDLVRTSWSAALRFGWNHAIGRWVSLYPRLVVGIESDHDEYASFRGYLPVVDANVTQVGAWAELLLPLLVHVRPHFFLGGGPSVIHHFATLVEGNAVMQTTVAATALLGGTWGGELPADDEPELIANTREAPRPRVPLGVKKQIVFSGDVGVGGAWSTVLGPHTQSERFAADFNPGLDYFVANHVSLGVVGNVHYDSTSRFDLSQTAGFGLAATCGVSVWLADWLQWYVRASLGGGWARVWNTVNGFPNAYSWLTLTAGIYAPLVIPIQEHFFFGFGPRLSQDLIAIRGGDSQYQLRGTTVGANTVLGGWL